MNKMPTIENGFLHNLPPILEDLTHEMVQVNPSPPTAKKGGQLGSRWGKSSLTNCFHFIGPKWLNELNNNW